VGSQVLVAGFAGCCDEMLAKWPMMAIEAEVDALDVNAGA
jgi:hypothetical protein